MNKKIPEKLFNEAAEALYANREQYQNHLFEQYKLYVEMTDRISGRRQIASTFFLSMNTAIIGIGGYLNACVLTKQHGKFWPMAICATGIALNYLWYRIIRSYRDLNKAKFKVIHEIEKRLPLSPYDAEWEAIGCGENRSLYLPFTHIEMRIPWIFIFIYAIAFIYITPLYQECHAFIFSEKTYVTINYLTV